MSNELPSPYDMLGGETAVRKIVDDFYDYMDTLEDASEIRQLHAKSLKGSREKLFLFLSGWLGGPDLYVEKYGHPRLRGRHLPFKIGIKERDQWMLCMEKSLQKNVNDERLRQQLLQSLRMTANHMRNQQEFSDEPGIGLQIT